MAGMLLGLQFRAAAYPNLIGFSASGALLLGTRVVGSGTAVPLPVVGSSLPAYASHHLQALSSETTPRWNMLDSTFACFLMEENKITLIKFVDTSRI